MSTENDAHEMLVNPALLDTDHKDPFVQDESSLTLAELIPRIISERGSILNVTEESLREEIEELQKQEEEQDDHPGFFNAVNNEDITDTAIAVENDSQQVDTLTHEEFAKEKNEILALLRSALNESSLSLDFISLLISCVRPAAGSISMSPHLKQHVPVGSLNSAHVEIQEAEKELRTKEYEKEAKVGQGWKLQSLEYSSKILKESNLRLTEEVLKEKEYWNNICKIVKSNEVLIKMNSGSSRDIGVKYGFGDSGSNYFDKGVGLLKKDVTNGEVQFKPLRSNNLERDCKIVKVKILRRIDDELKTVSETNVKNFFKKCVANDDNSIGSEIAKARFYLFEEELFHELIKEATTLLPYQVQVINNKIILELNDEIIEIEAVSLDDTEFEEMDESIDSTKADYISSFLRLMLSQDHRQNITKKFKNPRPLRQDQRHLPRLDANKPALLLRPLIGHSKHNHYIKQVRKICESLIEKYYGDSGDNNSTLEIIKYYNIKPRDYEKDKFVRCTRVPNSKIIFGIVSPQDRTKKLNFQISILNTSNFCNIIMNVKTFWSGQDRNLVDVNFSEFIDVEDSLDWAIKSY